MENSQRNKIGFIVFDEDHEFFLVKIADDMYDIPVTDVPNTKYHEIIYVIKLFMDEFGKKMDCWEQMMEYDGVSYYCIQTDLEDLNVDEHDDYDIISINDLNNVECKKRVKWLSYMALDTSIRKKKLS